MWKRTPPQKTVGLEQKKKQNKETPTQIQDVISKISATCLYHSLSRSSELNYCSNHEAPPTSPALLPMALPVS